MVYEQDPVNGAQLAGEWGTREAFVSVATTNLPMIFPLLRTWFRPLFGSALSSTPTPYKGRPGFQTIGGSSGMSHGRSRRGAATGANDIGVNSSFSESEERIVNNVKMQDLKVYAGSAISADKPSNGIVVSNEFQITEDRTSQNGENAQRVHETW